MIQPLGPEAKAKIINTTSNYLPLGRVIDIVNKVDQEAHQNCLRQVVKEAERELYPTNTFSISDRIEHFIIELKKQAEGK